MPPGRWIDMAQTFSDLLSLKVYDAPCTSCRSQARERVVSLNSENCRLMRAGATSALRSTRVTLVIENPGVPKPFGKLKMYKDASLA